MSKSGIKLVREGFTFTASNADESERAVVSFGHIDENIVVDVEVVFDGQSFKFQTIHGFDEKGSWVEIHGDHKRFGVESLAAIGEVAHNIASNFRDALGYLALHLVEAGPAFRLCIEKHG